MTSTQCSPTAAKTSAKASTYRLALIRALLAHRPLVLLVEPFVALDDDSIVSVVKALREEAARGAAIILATHIISGSMQDVRVKNIFSRQTDTISTVSRKNRHA